MNTKNSYFLDNNDSVSKSLSVDKWLLEKILTFLGHPAIEMVLWDGQSVKTVEGKPTARIHFRSRQSLLKIAFDADFYFGECYSQNLVDVEGDLAQCLLTINRAKFAPSNKLPMRNRIIERLKPKLRNTLRRSKQNIHHHYDISNDFYKHWLDQQMLYTCAYFPTKDMSLESAQIAKMDHVCRKLWLTPGETVVEAGCGWGTLALHMAQHYDVNVIACNISKEQLKHAREQAKLRNLDDRVTFIETDYRELEGQYDAFVSVGMLEHVGKHNYNALGETINRVLKPDGRGLIHSIGRDQARHMNSWIEKRIFPGAYPPSISELMHILEPWRFSVLDLENLRMHYAKTIHHWLTRFESAVTDITAQFDEPFVRAWRLYLAGSEATFQSGELQLYQILFSRKGSEQIPWHREHVYCKNIDS